MSTLRFLALAALCGAAGCSSYTTVCLTGPESAGFRVDYAGGMALDGSGGVFVATAGNLLRYDAGDPGMSPLLLEGCRRPQDLAVTDDGVPLALFTDSIHGIFAGRLVPVVALPLEGSQQGRLLSTHGDLAWVLAGPSPTVLLRYSFTTKDIRKVAVLEDGAATAICAVNGGCLVAAGDTVGKIYDSEGEGLWVTLCAVAGSVLTGVAADEDSETVWFSDSAVTYAWTDGKVVSFYPMGGRLSFCDNRLAILSPHPVQLVQVARPAKRASEIAGVMESAETVQTEPAGAAEPDLSGQVGLKCEWFENDDELTVNLRLTGTGASSVADPVVRLELLDAANRTVFEKTLCVPRRVRPGETLALDGARIVDRATLAAAGVGRNDVALLRWTVTGARDAAFMDRLTFPEKISFEEGEPQKCRMTIANANEVSVEITLYRLEYTDAGGNVLRHEHREAADLLAAGQTRSDLRVEMREVPEGTAFVSVSIEYAEERASR